MSAPDRRDRFLWQQRDVEHSRQPGEPIDLRRCMVVPGPDPICGVHGLACAELWGELEDARVDQLLEERFFDLGLDDNDGFRWSDPDR